MKNKTNNKPSKHIKLIGWLTALTNITTFIIVGTLAVSHHMMEDSTYTYRVLCLIMLGLGIVNFGYVLTRRRINPSPKRINIIFIGTIFIVLMKFIAIPIFDTVTWYLIRYDHWPLDLIINTAITILPYALIDSAFFQALKKLKLVFGIKTYIIITSSFGIPLIAYELYRLSTTTYVSGPNLGNITISVLTSITATGIITAIVGKLSQNKSPKQKTITVKPTNPK